MTTIERIAHAQGVSDFQKASDALKLKVYILTLEEIFRALGQDLQKFPVKYLEDLKVALHDTINGFYDLRAKPTVKYVDIIEAMEKLMEANSYLLSATTASKGGTVKDVEYYMALQRCRMVIFEALELLSKSR
jgi:hypothetical protein